MNWYKKLHWQIIIGLLLGLCWGLFAAQFQLGEFSTDFIKPLGTMFVYLLELIAVPLVLASLIVGVTNLSDIRKLYSMGSKTIAIYLITTVIAICIGLVFVNIIQPGKTLPPETRDQLKESYQDNVESRQTSAEEFVQRGPLAPIVDIVPRNIFAAAANNGSMLQVVFVAILFGVAMIRLGNEKAQPLISFFDSLNDVVIKIVDLIMYFAPIGVFGLMSAIIVDLAGNDLSKAFDLLFALGWYMITIIIGLLVHLLLTYQIIFKLFIKNIGFFEFLKRTRKVLLLGFSTSSSSATLPVTMEEVEKKLGVNEEVSSFVLPVGATVNMDGTSLYQAVATVFIAQALGMDLNFAQQLTIVITATLASIGTAGVPGAGIIMLVIVLKSVNVPVEGIALILGVDRILDMLRTILNISGDMVVCSAVATMEGKIEEVSPEQLED